MEELEVIVDDGLEIIVQCQSRLILVIKKAEAVLVTDRGRFDAPRSRWTITSWIGK